MSYIKAMKHANNIRKVRKCKPFHPICHTHFTSSDAGNPMKQEEECPNCKYYRPILFIKNGKCDLCSNKK